LSSTANTHSGSGLIPRIERACSRSSATDSAAPVKPTPPTATYTAARRQHTHTRTQGRRTLVALDAHEREPPVLDARERDERADERGRALGCTRVREERRERGVRVLELADAVAHVWVVRLQRAAGHGERREPLQDRQAGVRCARAVCARRQRGPL
jgi:hypothetical protein